MTGKVIGPYQILSILGKGVRGDVYLAQDCRLGRKIALKLLPGHFTQDHDRLRRFEREARVASALNHPNILTIHEIGEQDGNIFIATEFIEGQTLRQQIADGPLKLPEALDIAVQVARALGAAHAAGIVHRDIRPENIMSRGDGFVKVLDFGLAKLNEGQALIGQAGNPTDYRSETETGTVMGTTRYLSPEQARGLKVDGRTDIFSLGVVIYELVTALHPFEGETATDVTIAIVEKEPLPLSQLAEVPAHLEEIVSKALSKNAGERYQTASELESDLKRLKRRLEIEESGMNQALESPKVGVERLDQIAPKTPKQLLRTPWGKRFRQYSAFRIALSLPAVLVVVFLVNWLRSQLSKPTVLRMIQITHDDRSKGNVLVTDGARIYFTEFVTGGQAIPVSVSTDGGETLPIPMALPTACVLDISRDGRELLMNGSRGLWKSGPLWVLPVTGGMARRLGDLEAGEATWSPDGKKLVYTKDGELFIAKSDGTGSRRLVSLPGGPLAPHWAPDGTRLTVSVVGYPQAGYTSLWELSADGLNLRQRFPDWKDWHPTNDFDARWTPDGKYFLFSSDRGGGGIRAIRERGRFFKVWNPEPVRLTSGPMGTLRPLPSKDGKRIFFFAIRGQVFDQLMRYDPKSAQWTPYLSGISGEQVAFSRDGQWITFVSFPEPNLVRSKADGSQTLQLTSPPVQCSKPRWSPDGKRIAYMARTPGQPWQIWVATADGGSNRPLIPRDVLPRSSSSTVASQGKSNCAGDCDPDWSPDGNSLVFYRQPSLEEEAENVMPIQILDLRTNQTRRLVGKGDRYYPRWSPDGRYLAATAEYGKELALFAFDLQQWVKLAEGDLYYPSWSRDGKSVWFVDWTTQMSKRGYYRVEIHSHRLERVTDMPFSIENGTDGGWVGLTSDDSPMTLFQQTGAGHNQIHAIDWDAP